MSSSSFIDAYRDGKNRANGGRLGVVSGSLSSDVVSDAGEVWEVVEWVKDETEDAERRLGGGDGPSLREVEKKSTVRVRTDDGVKLFDCSASEGSRMRGGEGKGDGKETDREEKKSSVRERGGFGFSPCNGRELIGGVGNGEKEDEKNAFVLEPGGVATEREDAKTLAVFVLEAAGARSVDDSCVGECPAYKSENDA